MKDKELIQKRFTKNLLSYNEHARIQKRMAERLVSFIPRDRFDNILEIGCGTGFLTGLAVKKLNYKTYAALDIVKDCESFIKEIAPEIEFVHADVEEYLNTREEKYDLILSNAVFQWIEDFEGFVKRLLAKLNPGGVLLFSTFGKENFWEIYHISQNTLKYYSPLEIKEMFEEFAPIAEEEIHIMAFQNPKEVLKHLHLTGVNAIESKQWTKSDLIKFENNYLNLCNSRPTLTYNPIYVKLQNE